MLDSFNESLGELLQLLDVLVNSCHSMSGYRTAIFGWMGACANLRTCARPPRAQRLKMETGVESGKSVCFF